MRSCEKKVVHVSFWILCMMAMMLLCGKSVYAADYDYSDDELYNNLGYDSALEIPMDEMVTDYMEDPNQRYYYKFNIDKPGTIDIQFGLVHPNNEGVAYTLVLENNSRNILFTMDYKDSRKTISSDKFSFKEGTYYVYLYLNGVSAQPNYNNYLYNLLIDYEESSNWESENNDGFNVADEILVNKSYYGRITNPRLDAQDSDWYCFTIQKDGYVKINFEHVGYTPPTNASNSTYWYIELYTSNFEKISLSLLGGASSSVSSNRIGLEKGTYYIKIYPDIWYSSRDKYRLKVNHTVSSVWETECNDTTDTPDVIGIAETIHGTNGFSTDVDYYQFTLNREARVTININQSKHDGDNPWHIEVFNQYFSDQRIVSGNSYSYEATLAPGTYFLKMIKQLTTSAESKYSLTMSTYTVGKKNGTTYLMDANGNIIKKSGIVLYNGERYYFTNGKLNTSRTLVKHEGKYYFVNKGKVQNETTLVKYKNQWCYVKNGIFTQDTTLVKYNNQWWYVKKGKLCTDATLVKFQGNYWYVKGGRIAKVTTLVKYGGKYWYVRNGKMDKSTTLVKYGNYYWYVSGGTIKNTTTLAKYNGKYYFVYRGKVNFNYTGTYVWNGVRWKIVKGVVTGRV